MISFMSTVEGCYKNIHDSLCILPKYIPISFKPYIISSNLHRISGLNNYS